MQDKKVLLLNPPWPGQGFGTRSQNRIIKQRADLHIQYPLQMGYSCSIFKSFGYKVFYIDSIVQGLSYEGTEKRIRRIKPDIIFMETVTPSIDYDLEFLTKIKKFTKSYIILTGPHVTRFPKETLLECKAIDLIIKGEYDTRLIGVLENFDNLEKVKGIAFRKKNRIVDNDGPIYEDDLDRLPFPDRETIPLNWYGEAWYNKKPFTNMLTSRGCPYGCAFCISSHIMEGKKWRVRSIDNVVKELLMLTKKYGVKEINIDDPTFTISRERVLEFCKALQKNSIKILWTCNGRVDNVDYEMLKEMKKAGCKMIRYGIESGSLRVLRSINKGITFQQMKEAFKLTKKAGILALGGFMFGFPEDDKKSIEATLQLAKGLKPDLIQASIPMAYPGTPLYERAKKEGKVVAKKWSEFDMTAGPVVKTKDTNGEYLNGILRRAYKEFYFRPGFFIQTIFNIRRPSDIPRIYRSFVTLVKTVWFYGKRKSFGI